MWIRKIDAEGHYETADVSQSTSAVFFLLTVLIIGATIIVEDNRKYILNNMIFRAG